MAASPSTDSSPLLQAVRLSNAVVRLISKDEDGSESSASISRLKLKEALHQLSISVQRASDELGVENDISDLEAERWPFYFFFSYGIVRGCMCWLVF